MPIRKTFLQKGSGKNVQPGLLAEFVRAQDERGLEAYLLIHALASGNDFSCRYPATTWALTLGLFETATKKSATGAVSKIMKRLDNRGLISRDRVGRQLSVTLLDENGQGGEYTHPHNTDEQYFRLPYTYWRKSYYKTLSLPAKAMLLISLSQKDGFSLPVERTPGWYGISADTAERGFRELREHSVLETDATWKRDYRSSIMHTKDFKHTLIGDFSLAARNAD